MYHAIYRSKSSVVVLLVSSFNSAMYSLITCRNSTNSIVIVSITSKLKTMECTRHGNDCLFAIHILFVHVDDIFIESLFINHRINSVG